MDITIEEIIQHVAMTQLAHANPYPTLNSHIHKYIGCRTTANGPDETSFCLFFTSINGAHDRPNVIWTQQSRQVVTKSTMTPIQRRKEGALNVPNECHRSFRISNDAKYITTELMAKKTVRTTNIDDAFDSIIPVFRSADVG